MRPREEVARCPRSWPWRHRVGRRVGLGAPTGLTLYGRLTWNLDALVHDFYGGSRTCFQRQTRTIHRCASPSFNDGLYRVTFRSARHSSFRAVQVTNPVGNVNAIGLRIGGRYIRCGANSWIAFTNSSAVWGEPVFCVHA